MSNLSISPEYKNSIALYIAHTNPNSIKSVISPWKGKQQIELIMDGSNQSCWAFRILDTPIIADIDSNDLKSFTDNLKRNHISVNQLYRIPICETLESSSPQIETLLHRSVRKGATDVFKYLLANGAKPRRTGPSGQNILEMLATQQQPGLKTRIKMGKLLVAAGITSEEIQQLRKDFSSNRSTVNFCNGLLTYIDNIKNYEGKSIIKRHKDRTLWTNLDKTHS